MQGYIGGIYTRYAIQFFVMRVLQNFAVISLNAMKFFTFYFTEFCNIWFALFFNIVQNLRGNNAISKLLKIQLRNFVAQQTSYTFLKHAHFFFNDQRFDEHR